MFELKPIILDNGIITIHPIRNSDLIPEKYEKIKNDLFAIYNNEITTKYIPEKKVKTLNDIEMKLAKARLGYAMPLIYLLSW